MTPGHYLSVALVWIGLAIQAPGGWSVFVLSAGAFVFIMLALAMRLSSLKSRDDAAMKETN